MCKGGNFPCYAYKLANGRLKDRYLANHNISPMQTVEGGYGTSKILDSLDPFYPRFWDDRIETPIHNFRFHRFVGRQRYRDRGIFVCDMGELFGDWIPREWQEQIFETIKHCPNDRFYLLTKQPQNLPKFSPFSKNCWVGATITNDSMMKITQQAFDDIWAKIKFISFEPLLGRLSKESLKQIRDCVYQWVIIGAQTKPYKPPSIESIREIIEAADKAGIPVFLKNNLRPILPEESPFYEVIDEDPMQTPRLRQEMPNG